MKRLPIMIISAGLLATACGTTGGAPRPAPASPARPTLLGLRIAAGAATVDLSWSFESAASPPAMPLRIAQMVYTLTQFPTVTGLRFEINGQGVTVIGGVPVQSPQTRAMYTSYLPAITVQSPVIGEQVTSPV